jgi:hypothetical protein
MKKIYFLLLAICLIGTACEEKDKQCNNIEKPADLKPIDWENYNDAYTVYRNYYSSCGAAKREDIGKDIMIYGWICTIYRDKYMLENGDWLYDGVKLVDNPNFYNPNKKNSLPEGTWIGIESGFPIDEFQAKLDACDLAKKCFIKGKLGFREIEAGMCCKSLPYIHIIEIENIYFEEIR